MLSAIYAIKMTSSSCPVKTQRETDVENKSTKWFSTAVLAICFNDGGRPYERPGRMVQRIREGAWDEFESHPECVVRVEDWGQTKFTTVR